MYYRNNYYSNAHFKAITEYIEDIQAKRLPVKTGVVINKEEKMRQYAIYNIEHLDTSDFKKKFGISFKKKFDKIYQELKKLQLITEKNNSIKLTTQGLNYRDLIDKQFFSPRIKKLERAHRYSINIIIFGFS
jgi:coproporphyrinogen III oxidase-like Fe-S oxidoreductase